MSRFLPRPEARGSRRDGGFTLIEVMIALAIFALMMALVWGTVSRTGAARKRFGALQDRYREARVALQRMTRDLSLAYISMNEDQTQLERRTYFTAESSGDIDSVTFSAFARTRLYADVNESDQTVISYYSAPDPDNRRQTNILRRELRRPGNEDFESLPGEADILFTNVEKLELSYWDPINQEWRDTWDTAGSETNKLPDRVKITLTFHDDPDDEDHTITLTTQARIVMQEVLNAYAN